VKSRALWIWTLLLSAIGLAVATRRMLLLLGVAPPLPGREALDTGFLQHPALTMVHIVPGMIFVVHSPLQLVRSLRTKRPVLHRWCGRVCVASGAVIGATALVMSPQMAIGGATESAATMTFGAFFLFALARGFVAIRRGKVALHREWMIRAFAVGMAVAFVRPIVGVFFATSGFTHLTPHDFFGIAFWLGFCIQAMAAEVWIRRGRRLS
jgi:uncharacterized membrane protein